MTSIKQRKSKGKAIHPTFATGYPVYQLRKWQFADAAPAKMLRPLRAIRKVYEQALQAWHRSFVDGQPQQPFPYGEEVTYRNAVRLAKAGQGQLVHRCAS